MLISLTAFTWYSCKKESVEAPALSYNYFPTESGKYIIYDVDSIYHSETDNNNDDSVFSYHFQIKDKIDSSFVDLEGRVNQVRLRYHRNSDTLPWQLTEVWTQYLSSTSAYLTEENIKYHKLSFPINATITWNGNDSNTEEEELYYYDYFHESDVLNGLSFDSTLSVIQIDENNFVETIYGNEKYAAGVGMIYKEHNDLGKTNGQVVKGLEYKMVVVEYGVE
ncbi:MAG: hypothetical protein IPP27_08050 [Bacteroidetes bacterium]|nr:hypothetical protein [Bacteroidota bacterium]MBL0032121.1 hypothetical protein [Bacteroidota bacterium]MBP6426677.1 hypothetical protein [Bacteroidia bacterium]MBP6657603.1 hypothetical protein [Bacteroidia bacterium]